MDLELRGRGEGERQDIGVGGDGVAAAERFDTGLEEFAATARPLPEYGAEIGVAGLTPRRTGREVVETDRHRVLGAERELPSVGVAGEEHAPTEVLAGDFDEHCRIMDDGRFDEDVAGFAEQSAK